MVLGVRERVRAALVKRCHGKVAYLLGGSAQRVHSLECFDNGDERDDGLWQEGEGRVAGWPAGDEGQVDSVGDRRSQIQHRTVGRMKEGWGGQLESVLVVYLLRVVALLVSFVGSYPAYPVPRTL